MTDLVEYRPGDAAGQLVAWAEAARAAHTLATALVKTNVCPPAFRNKAEEATAVVIMGAELGLTPIASLRSMYEIRGVLGMYVQAQVALVQSRGHRIWTVHETDDAVTVAGQRAGSEHVEEVTWTIARARQAGYIRRGKNGEPSKYESDPRTMLRARAAGEVARRIAADVLAGVPEVDEPADTSQALTGERGGPARVIQRQPVERPGIEPGSDGFKPSGTTTPPTPPGTDPASEQESPPPDAEPVADTVPPDEEGAEPEPDLLTEAQRARIMVGLNARGVRGHDERVAFLAHVVERPVASTNDLTVEEASTVIDALEWGAER